MGLNILAFILIMTRNLDVDKFIYDQNEIRYHKEWYRMLTSGFMHMSIFHIFFNMYALLSFGQFLEQVFMQAFGPDIGRIIYLLVFIISIFGGSLYCYFTKMREPNYLALGASGGVFGIVYIAVLIDPSGSISLFFIPVAIPGWILGIVITLGSIIFSLLPKAGNVSHEGHLGGALAGVLVMFVIFSYIGIPFKKESYLFLLFGVLPAGLYLLLQILTPKLIDNARHWLSKKIPSGD